MPPESGYDGLRATGCGLRATGWFLRLAVLVVSAILLLGCPRDDQGRGEPPLRPLVYTESPSGGQMQPILGYEMWMGESDPTRYPDEPPVLDSDGTVGSGFPSQNDTSTPDALARVLFTGLVLQQEELVLDLVMTPQQYADVARTSYANAADLINAVRSQTADVYLTFRGEVLSEQRLGGLGALLEIESVRAGSGRLVTGEVADDEQVPAMVLGTELRMRLRDTEQVFRLRLPKLLLNAHGQWRLAEAPEIGGMLSLFIDMGFHLSPSLLEFEHHPLPYFSGNYWTYRIRREPRDLSDEANEDDNTSSNDSAVDEELEPDQEEELPTFREDVLSRDDYDGYALVRIRRSYDDLSHGEENVYYLLTARRLYYCERECRRNIEDVSWLLAHLSRRTPELVFPLRPGIGWRTGGRYDSDGEYQTRSRFELADVPAGFFEQAVCVSQSIVEGHEHRFFVRGLGIVLTRIDGGVETTYYELVDYRSIP